VTERRALLGMKEASFRTSRAMLGAPSVGGTVMLSSVTVLHETQ